MTKISIIAGTITGNRGAEAMLTTIIGRVLERDPSAAIHVFSYYPKSDQKKVSTPNINIFSSTPFYLVTVLFPCSLLLMVLKRIGLGGLRNLFPTSVVALEQSDALVDIAGVAFIDGREKFLPFNILTIVPAMLLGVPVVKFSQAIGPFRHSITNLAARLFLPRCQKIFARGDLTEQHLRELPLPEGYVENVPDVVFLHQPGDSISTENEEYVEKLEQMLQEVTRSNDKPLIGFCPSAVIAANAKKEGWDYPELLYQIVKALLRKGYPVFLFPNATRKQSKEKLRNNDLPVIAEIVEYFTSENDLSNKLVYVTEDMNTDAIRKLLDYCDFAVVSRFHAMIATLCLEKPLLVLGWGHKYFEEMEKFGLGEYVLDYKNTDVPAIIQQIERLIRNGKSLKAKIHTRLPEIRKSSQRQFEYLFELLNL